MATSLSEFLQPLSIDTAKVHRLAQALCETFRSLARESENQFLSTPISESVLRPDGDESGRYLAIDIGGTNLRVGFIELLYPSDHALNGIPNGDSSRVRRLLEKAWPIGEQLKNEKAEDLFAWIGHCIAEVVRDASTAWNGELAPELPMGVTFSFPMIQHTLSDATLMSMGKGFAITSNLDLGRQLLQGYESHRGTLPRIRIAAIANDTVATLVSFCFQAQNQPGCKAAMGLIGGTGSNATIPLFPRLLHASKRLNSDETKIVVNTEWSINGAAPPLQALGLITPWDKILDLQGEVPGFQPFEYMTAGRYLGELGRLILLDYLTSIRSIPPARIPKRLQTRHGLTTAFLGNIRPDAPQILQQLDAELPGPESWTWTTELAHMLYSIAKAIQVRAAGLTAAAVLGLLGCAEELDINHLQRNLKPEITELMVGYTGGCIVHFQDYLHDCQDFLDEISRDGAVGVKLHPCHDGGIMGAGILAGRVSRTESIASGRVGWPALHGLRRTL
ncbi:hypothetical protein BP5796_05198 [Coleophoma crateriformis]|uniref:Phosphotransferase n=1 Tax=Coleophoma crateriformis TaxID=565419 RepID=A0A3D8S2V9_9HELO|nr:hypothetical protein BP5796_05198 [Coleophoma crateriformis]